MKPVYELCGWEVPSLVEYPRVPGAPEAKAGLKVGWAADGGGGRGGSEAWG